MFRGGFLVILLLFPLFLCASELRRATDVNFQQVGDKVYITYHLDKKADVKVYVSTDGGRTWGSPLTAVKGDVGLNVSKGKNVITWSPLDEGREISSTSVCFKVSPSFPAASLNAHRFWKSVGVTTGVVALTGGIVAVSYFLADYLSEYSNTQDK